MRKGSLKKLAISRETLRNLSAGQFTEATGGLTGRSECGGCRSYTDCASCLTPTVSPTSTCV